MQNKGPNVCDVIVAVCLVLCTCCIVGLSSAALINWALTLLAR